MQGTLMLVATLTATISFQVADNPPGGVWQDYNDKNGCSTYDGGCVAGNALLAHIYTEQYLRFTKYAIVSFISSLVILLLAISGLPLKNKICTWLMTIAMILAITFLLRTFMLAIQMVTPDHIFTSTTEALATTADIWVVLVGLVVLFATIRLFFWLIGFLIKLIRFVRKKVGCVVREKIPRPMRNQDSA